MGEGTSVGRRLLRQRAAALGLAVLAVAVLGAWAGERLWRYGPADLVPGAYARPPSWQHPMGTDSIGHDLLAQVMRGTVRSSQIGLLVTLLATALGTAVGAVAGYYRGWVDGILMRAVDVLLCVPGIAVLAVLGARVRAQGWPVLALVLAGLLWVPFARVVRGLFLTLREQEYVAAARALGASHWRIIVRHLLPNAAPLIAVNVMVMTATAILAETGLSYLGFGIQAPDTSLGLLVRRAQGDARTSPWLFYFPGMVIVLLVLAVSLVGEGLRRALDPREVIGTGGRRLPYT
jgi:peptide/nickel transport system permease protein